MNNLNSILIEGNLVKDPLVRTSPKGTAICTFPLASNRFYRKDNNDHLGKEVSYFDIESWGKLAESCQKLGHKGRGVRVVGRLKQYRWADTDGKPHSKISIVAEHVEFKPELFNRTEEENPDYSNEPMPEEEVPLDEVSEPQPDLF
jgi:single-strand DNA-binding protein